MQSVHNHQTQLKHLQPMAAVERLEERLFKEGEHLRIYLSQWLPFA